MNSFTKKIIEVHFTLGKGSFGGEGNTKIIRGLDCKVDIHKPGLPSKNKLKAEISNVLLEDMEQLTTLSFHPLSVENNKVAVFAGDEQTGLHLAFAGDITSAFGDFSNPDVVFKVDALTGHYASLTPAQPLTFKGAVDVAVILETLAADMGYAFKNTGVSVMLSCPVLNGSPMEKAQKAAKAANIDILVDDETLIISAKGGGNGDAEGNAVLLNKDTGMLGHPSFNNKGIVVSSIYNPALSQGGLVKVESIVPKASGVWRISNLRHKMQTFSDLWQSDLEAEYVTS